MKKYILKFKANALLYMIMGTLTSLNGIAMTYGIQYIVEIVTNGETDKILNMFLIIVLYLLGMVVAFILYGIARNRFCMKVMQEIRADLFKALVGKNVVQFSRENTGYYTSLFLNDLKVVESTLTSSFLLVLQVEGVVFSLIYAFIQNAVIGISLIVVGFSGIIIPMLSQELLKKNQEKLMDEAAKHNAFINNSLQGYEVIKNYQVEENILNKYKLKNDRYGRKVFWTTAFQHCTNNSTQVIVISLQLLLIAFSGVMVLKNELSISFVTVVIGLSSSVVQAMCGAAEAIVERKSGLGVCKKIFDEIDGYEDCSLKTDICFEEALRFEDLSFSYVGVENAVLENINVSFEKGKKYLVIGESGTGKSTFIKLLLQYYDNYQGKIYIDELDVRNVPSESVMRQFAVIQQNVFIFEDTLRNNITLFDDTYSDECIMEAVKKAGLSELVGKLEGGLDYVIREGGQNLSGGERQRISIARAFLRNRKIWIMDEATSNLDKEMAEQIEQTVLNIPDITVIMIAHYYDEDTIKRCDGVYRIENKKLQEVACFV